MNRPTRGRRGPWPWAVGDPNPSSGPMGDGGQWERRASCHRPESEPARPCAPRARLGEAWRPEPDRTVLLRSVRAVFPPTCAAHARLGEETGRIQALRAHGARFSRDSLPLVLHTHKLARSGCRSRRRIVLDPESAPTHAPHAQTGEVWRVGSRPTDPTGPAHPESAHSCWFVNARGRRISRPIPPFVGTLRAKGV